MSTTDKLPLELLKEKYIPVSEVPEKCGVSVAKVMNLIHSKKLRYAEFRVEGEYRRTPHINPEDLFSILDKEGDTFESDSFI